MMQHPQQSIRARLSQVLALIARLGQWARLMLKYLASIVLTLLFIARDASIELLELAVAVFAIGIGVVLLLPVESINPIADRIGNVLTPATEPYAAAWLITLGLIKLGIGGIHRSMGWVRIAIAGALFFTWLILWYQLARINPAGLDAAFAAIMTAVQGLLYGRRSAIHARPKSHHVYQF